MKKKIWIPAAAVLLFFGSAAAVTAAEYETEPSERETEASDPSELVASADEMSTPVDVVDDSMVPIYANSLKEGTYSVDVRSSSSMFHVTDCRLTVEDGAMTAAMTMSGDGYLMLFMGTGEEAVESPEEEYILFELNEEGKQVYTVPVEALDQGISCAAWSRRREKWYDRTLVFTSASLPQDAIQESAYVTAESLGLADGSYLVDVTLSGGSGKTAVESPARMTVEDGTATAAVVWGSPKYDYMIVDDEKYDPVNTEGNSVFEIPVLCFDWNMPVIVDTVALGTPHELEYTLYFDSSTVTEE